MKLMMDNDLRKSYQERDMIVWSNLSQMQQDNIKINRKRIDSLLESLNDIDLNSYKSSKDYERSFEKRLDNVKQKRKLGFSYRSSCTANVPHIIE